MAKKYKRSYKRTCDKKRKQNNQSTKNKKQKIRRLSNLDMSEILMTISKIKIFAKPREQKNAGEKGIANFLLSLSPESLQELVATASKMQEAR